MAGQTLTQSLSALSEVELERLARLAERLLPGRARLSSGRQANRWRAGNGGEFLDYRPYLPGDDLRAVDWRASLRCREWQVRRYQDEASADWMICLDRSASMGLPDPGKWSLAVRLAAAWAYLLLHLDHRVGVLTFSHRVDDLCPGGRGPAQYGQVLRFLQAVTPRSAGGESLLGSCAAVIGKRAAVIVISDFLVEDGMQADLGRLIAPEIHAFQVLAATELPAATGAQALLCDVETQQCQSLYLSAPAWTQANRALVHLQEELNRYCRRRGIAFTICDSGRYWQTVLLEHLRKLQPAYG